MLAKLFKIQKEVINDRTRWWLFGTMLVFGVFGFIASFVLSVEKLVVLQNANAELSCSFNLVLNCATVMQTPQASLFGFPNSYLGIMGFAIVVTVAMSGLLKNTFTRPYLLLAQFFYVLGLIFAYWLFFQSVYVIQILCPWCLVVTVSTTLIVEALTHYNLRRNSFGLSKDINKKVQNWLDNGYDKLLVAGWLVFMTALVLIKFGDALLA